MDEAIGDAKEAVRLDPRLPSAHVLLGTLEGMRNNRSEALASARAALALDANNSPAHYLYGSVAYRDGDLKGCLAHLNRYLELTPLPATRDPADPYCIRGNALMYLNRPREALGSFLMARKLNSASASAAHGVYDAYADLGKWHLVAKTAVDLRKGFSTDSRCALLLAYAQAKIGQKTAALTMIDQSSAALEGIPDANWYGYVGTIYFLVEENEKALQCFDIALKKDDSSLYALRGKALMLASCAKGTYRDGRMALKLASKVREEEKSRSLVEMFQIRTNLLLADASAECGNFVDAVRLTRAALFLAGPEREQGEFEERVRLFEAKRPYRYIAPGDNP